MDKKVVVNLLEEINAGLSNPSGIENIKESILTLLWDKEGEDLPDLFEKKLWELILNFFDDDFKEELKELPENDKYDFINDRIKEFEAKLKEQEKLVKEKKEQKKEGKIDIKEYNSGLKIKKNIEFNLKILTISFDLLKKLREQKDILLALLSKDNDNTNSLSTASNFSKKVPSTRFSNRIKQKKFEFQKPKKEKKEEKDELLDFKVFKKQVLEEDFKSKKLFIKKYYNKFSDGEKMEICDILLSQGVNVSFVKPLFNEIKAFNLKTSGERKKHMILFEKLNTTQKKIGLAELKEELSIKSSIDDFIEFYKYHYYDFYKKKWQFYLFRYSSPAISKLNSFFKKENEGILFLKKLKDESLLTKHEFFYFVVSYPNLDKVLQLLDKEEYEKFIWKAVLLVSVWRVLDLEKADAYYVLSFLEKFRDRLDLNKKYKKRKIEGYIERINNIKNKLTQVDLVDKEAVNKLIGEIEERLVNIREKHNTFSKCNWNKLASSENNNKTTENNNKTDENSVLKSWDNPELNYNPETNNSKKIEINQEVPNNPELYNNQRNENEVKRKPKVITVERNREPKIIETDEEIRELFDLYLEWRLRWPWSKEKIVKLIKNADVKALFKIIEKDIDRFYSKKFYYFDVLRKRINELKDELIEKKGEEWFSKVMDSIRFNRNCFEMDCSGLWDNIKKALGNSAIVVKNKRTYRKPLGGVGRKPKVKKIEWSEKEKIEIRMMIDNYFNRYLKNNWTEESKQAWISFVKVKKWNNLFWQLLKEKLENNLTLVKVVEKDFEENWIDFELKDFAGNQDDKTDLGNNNFSDNEFIIENVDDLEELKKIIEEKIKKGKVVSISLHENSNFKIFEKIIKLLWQDTSYTNWVKELRKYLENNLSIEDIEQKNEIFSLLKYEDVVLLKEKWLFDFSNIDLRKYIWNTFSLSYIKRDTEGKRYYQEGLKALKLYLKYEKNIDIWFVLTLFFHLKIEDILELYDKKFFPDNIRIVEHIFNRLTFISEIDEKYFPILENIKTYLLKHYDKSSFSWYEEKSEYEKRILDKIHSLINNKTWK